MSFTIRFLLTWNPSSCKECAIRFAPYRPECCSNTSRIFCERTSFSSCRSDGFRSRYAENPLREIPNVLQAFLIEYRSVVLFHQILKSHALLVRRKTLNFFKSSTSSSSSLLSSFKTMYRCLVVIDCASIARKCTLPILLILVHPTIQTVRMH